MTVKTSAKIGVEVKKDLQKDILIYKMNYASIFY